MIKRVKCTFCGHDGRRSVGGYQYSRCWECGGEAFTYEGSDANETKSLPGDAKIKKNPNQTQSKIVVDKRSKSYKDAIKEMMEADSSLTRLDAERIFDEEMVKLEN